MVGALIWPAVPCLCHDCPPPVSGLPRVPPSQPPLPVWRPGDLWVALVTCPALHPLVPKTPLQGHPPGIPTLPTALHPGTRLSLNLCPPATLPVSPQLRSLCPPGCLLCDTSVCPRRVPRHMGDALGRGWGPRGDPCQQGPWMRRAGKVVGHPNLPGVHLPLLQGMPQHGPRHGMVHGWQQGAGQGAVGGCRRCAGGSCGGRGRGGCVRQRGTSSRRQRGRGREVGSRRQTGTAACTPPLPAASPLCQQPPWQLT